MPKTNGGGNAAARVRKAIGEYLIDRTAHANNVAKLVGADASRILVGQFLLCLRLVAGCVAEPAGIQEFSSGGLHIGPLALEIVGDGPPQARIGDVMGRIGGVGHVAAGELVLALGAGTTVGTSQYIGLTISQWIYTSNTANIAIRDPFKSTEGQ